MVSSMASSDQDQPNPIFSMRQESIGLKEEKPVPQLFLWLESG
jgi:hypothetical protein